MTLDVEDRLRRTLHDVGSRLEVGDDDLNHGPPAHVASRPRWLALAIAAVVVLVVGGAAALTGLGPGIDEGSVVAGPGPGVEGSALLADHLLTTSQVEGVVEGLEEDEYRTGDHAVLGPTELGAGWTDQAASGVTRQWVRAYEWSFGDPVPEHIVHVSSTILEFASRPDAEAAVEKLRAEVPFGSPIGGTPPGYAAYGPPELEHPADVRSWFGFEVQGRHVVSVQLGAVGEVDRSKQFLALLELSNQQARSLEREQAADGVGQLRRSREAEDDGRDSVSTVAAPAQVYEVVAPVLENETHGPRLCLGTILYSLPPQCGEVPITNWDWTSADSEEMLAGTTWGNYHVTGTFDGTKFTLTETPRPADSEPTPPSDLHTPCQEPPGGWPVPDPDRTSEADIAAASTFVNGQPDAGGFWVDDDPTPPSDGATAMPGAVVNVSYTGDLANHEAELRRYWGGPLCLTQVARSRAELLAIQSEVTTEVADELGLFVLSAERDEVHNRVHLTAVLVTPDQQRSLDERYGPGVVVAESRLRPIG